MCLLPAEALYMELGCNAGDRDGCALVYFGSHSLCGKGGGGSVPM